jgi:hypothetical protein
MKAEQCIERVRNNGLIPCFTTDNAEYHIEGQGNMFYVGTMCNTGMIVHRKFKYDDCFTDDENLQEIVEVMQECELTDG